MLNRIVRLYHTVKYLKAKQIFWRLLNLTPRFISEVNEFPPISNEQLTYNFIPRNRITTDFEQFTFLNEKYSLKNVGWDDKSISKLWRYNLHYFDYLLQIGTIDNQVDSQKKIIEKYPSGYTKKRLKSIFIRYFADIQLYDKIKKLIIAKYLERELKLQIDQKGLVA